MAAELRIRPARRGDEELILGLIQELADFERLAHEVSATPELLAASLFGPEPAAEVVIAQLDGQTAGFALFFRNFSTFLGRSGLYLEDLYVRERYRGQGIGRALLEHLNGLARERGYGRMEWSVLDWNARAIGFYQSLGAEPMAEWTVYRLSRNGQVPPLPKK